MPNYNPQELQQKYEQWCKLHRQQLEAQQQFLKAEALQNELKTYYLDPQWMTDRERICQLSTQVKRTQSLVKMRCGVCSATMMS